MAKSKQTTDPLDYLSSKYADINTEIPNSLKEVTGSKLADYTLGSHESNKYAVGDLGLDYLPKYDKYFDTGDHNLISEDANALRAYNQSNIAQGFNAIVGGVASGLATAAEDVSYLADFDNHIKWLQGKDTWEKNWLAESMGKLKGDIDEAMPIYRPNNDVFDWNDSGFYWSSLKGVIDSAVGFGLPGGVIAKGVSSGMKAARLNALIQAVTKNASAVTITESLIGGGIQNYAEGKIMGIEAYENTKKELELQVSQKKLNLTPQQIEQYAGEAADNMLLYNRAMILSDAFGLHGIMKGSGITRIDDIAEKGWKNRVKDFGSSIIAPNADNVVLQGLKESVEEIAQNAMQMESEYEQLKLSGADVSKYDEDFGERISGFLTSDQALLEGMMGFFGGGPQRILSEAMAGNYTKAGKEKINKLREDRNAAIAESASFLEGRLEKHSELIKQRDAFLKKGNTERAKDKDREMFSIVAIDAFTNGTTGNLEEKLKDIANGNVSEEQKANLGEDYQAKALDMLDQLKVLEKEYIKHSNKANVSEITANYNNHLIQKERVRKAELALNENKALVEDDINDLLKTRKFKAIKKHGESVASDFTYDLNKIEDNPYNPKVDKAAYSQYNMFLNSLKEYEGFRDYVKINKYLNEGIYEKGKNKVNGLYEESRIAKKLWENSKNKSAEIDYIVRQNKKQADADDNLKEAYNEASIKSDELTPDKKYRNNKGKDYIFKGIEDDGRIAMWESPKKNSFKKYTQEEFDKSFKDADGNFNARVDKKEAANSQTKNSAKQAAENAFRKSDENKSSSEKKSSKNVPSIPATGEYEPSNIEEGEEDSNVSKLKLDEDNKSSNPSSLAWLSYNNFGTGRNGHPDITEFFERKDKSIVGTKVNITISIPTNATKEYKESEEYKKITDLKNRFDNRNSLSEEDKEKLISELVSEGYIKVTFLNEDGSTIVNNGTEIIGSIHLPNFNTKVKNYKSDSINLRTNIVKDLMNKGNISSKISSKSNGVLQTGDMTSLENVFENINDIDLSVRYSTGGFVTGVNDKNEIIEDEDLQVFTDPNARKGALFAKVKTSNGGNFPLRLFVEKINENEAELIYLIYNKLLDKEISPNAKISLDINENIRMFVESSDDARINRLFDILPDKKESTLLELLNYLVYEGESVTAKSKYPLFLKNGKVNYDSNPKTGETYYFTASNAEAKKKMFIKYLTENKLRNVKFKDMNNPLYKDYLISNGLLKTNAVPSENGDGVMFASPSMILETPNTSGTSIQKVKATNTLNNIIEDSKNFIVDPNNKDYYIGKKLKLLRQSIYTKGKQESSPAMNQGAAVGNMMDILGRIVFNNGTITREELIDATNKHNINSGNGYSVNIKQEHFDRMYSEMSKLRDELLSKDMTLYTDGLFVYKEFNEKAKAKYKADGVGGSMDMVAIDKDGNLHIVDFKTMTYNPTYYNDNLYINSRYESRVSQWGTQQTVYALLSNGLGLTTKSISIYNIPNSRVVNGTTIEIGDINAGYNYEEIIDDKKQKQLSDKLIKLDSDKEITNRLIEDTKSIQTKKDSKVSTSFEKFINENYKASPDIPPSNFFNEKIIKRTVIGDNEESQKADIDVVPSADFFKGEKVNKIKPVDQVDINKNTADAIDVATKLLSNKITALIESKKFDNDIVAGKMADLQDLFKHNLSEYEAKEAVDLTYNEFVQDLERNC